jgi:hypothetical protein
MLPKRRQIQNLLRSAAILAAAAASSAFASYNCPNGGTLVGTNCVQPATCAQPSSVCPTGKVAAYPGDPGYSTTATDCYQTTGVTAGCKCISQSLISCPAGQEPIVRADGTGYDCSSCQSGFYKSTADAQRCTACPAVSNGTATTALGATDVSQCTPNCNAGFQVFTNTQCVGPCTTCSGCQTDFQFYPTFNGARSAGNAWITTYCPGYDGIAGETCYGTGASGNWPAGQKGYTFWVTSTQSPPPACR